LLRQLARFSGISTMEHQAATGERVARAFRQSPRSLENAPTCLLKNVSRSRKWLMVFLFLQPWRAQIAAGFVIAVRTHAQDVR
jgi:hypothetical protein